MNAHEILDAIDAKIADRSILTHPFYVAWQAGELSKDDLRTYAVDYYPHVAAFPGYLRAAIDRTEDARVAAELTDNLHDEMHEPEAHPVLWLDFAAGLGADRHAVANAEATEKTAATVAGFDRCAARSDAAALASLYAYESQQPEVARQKSDGLRDTYGIEDEKTRAYFEVHAEADIEHRAGEREALIHVIEQGGQAAADDALAATDEALDAYWTLLDGVCDRIGLACGCDN